MGQYSEVDIQIRELAEKLDDLLHKYSLNHSVDPDRNELYKNLHRVREDFRKTGYLGE
jgi:hypothetical protein